MSWTCPKCSKVLKRASSKDGHNERIHGQAPGATSPSADVGGDGSFGSQIGRALDSTTEFTVSDVIKSGADPQRSSTMNVLPKGENRAVRVFRATGIPVVRKVGSKIRVMPREDR